MIHNSQEDQHDFPKRGENILTISTCSFKFYSPVSLNSIDGFNIHLILKTSGLICNPKVTTQQILLSLHVNLVSGGNHSDTTC